MTEILIPDKELHDEYEEARKVYVQLTLLKDSLDLKCKSLGGKMGLTAGNVRKLLELETHFRSDPRHEMTLTLRDYVEAEDRAA